MKKKISNPSLKKTNYRNLSIAEIEQLKNNQNISDDWDKISVSKVFDVSLVRNCNFIGENHIDDLSKETISAGEINLSTGLYNSTISHCTIHKNTAIYNVSFLSNYQIGEGSVLFNVNEIVSSKHPTFGNGYDEKNKNWIDIANENGGRCILAFDDIISADAFLWSRYREDSELLKQLQNFTYKTKNNNSLDYGIIDKKCVIKNVKSIENCKIESFCVIDGASRLSNLTIHSSADEPTYIGDNVELVNSIIGYSNKLVSAVKCFNIISGRNVKIELGARILHTFIGSNSTIACCEVLNNLVYPFHEQHHNNSFLIASTVMGQSNIAAGATIGSNHNSRSADGEIVARRGFWPGLETDFKHNSFFASFTLVAKGSYETELDVKLPFSLISKGASGNLQIFPAFWFRYNMYALARNAWKFNARDKRKIKAQNIETDYLAPDTIFEIMSAISILENTIKEASGNVPEINMFSFQKIDDHENVYLKRMAPKIATMIIKPLQALWIYKNLICYFAAKEIVRVSVTAHLDINKLFSNLPEIEAWQNFGGQLISEKETQCLIEDIKNNTIDSWNSLHQRYNDLWQKYPQDKLKFALSCWLELENITVNQVTSKKIKKLIEHSIHFKNALLKWVIEARKKDYDNPYRQSTYRNPAEMNAVLGHFEDDAFIIQMKKENKEYLQHSNTVISKL